MTLPRPDWTPEMIARATYAYRILKTISRNPKTEAGWRGDVVMILDAAFNKELPCLAANRYDEKNYADKDVQSDLKQLLYKEIEEKEATIATLKAENADLMAHYGRSAK